MIKMEEMYPLIVEAFETGNDFSFPIHGTSMQPLLHTSDVVRLRDIKNHKIKKGDITLHKRDNGQFVLHRVRKIKNGMYYIVGDHQTPIECDVKLEQIIGYAVSYKKKGKDKEYKLKGFKYSIYKLLVRIKPIRYIFARML